MTNKELEEYLHSVMVIVTQHLTQHAMIKYSAKYTDLRLERIGLMETAYIISCG